jgi:hypothetical protein
VECFLWPDTTEEGEHWGKHVLLLSLIPLGTPLLPHVALAFPCLPLYILLIEVLLRVNLKLLYMFETAGNQRPPSRLPDGG